MSDVRSKKFKVERWINEQEVCPSRKQVVQQFPQAPQRIIRALLQARKDKERSET